ncbi:MAG: hypothetical protein JO031_02070, partial [Ktedonobacteraceae bacterium]|nr:hypothetical protein [Ktedonobacteraceae bacterium]
MRCTGCGLPLSPQRTHCPRCGKAAGEPGKQEEQVNNQAAMAQHAFSALQEGSNVPVRVETAQGQPASIAQQQASNQMSDQMFYSSGTEQSPVQINAQPSEQDRTLLSSPEQLSNWRSASQPDQSSIIANELRPGEFQPSPRPPQRPGQTHSRLKVQPGFTIAGLCVLSGGLILVLVYIISLYLPPLSGSSQSTSTTAKTSVSQNISPELQGGLPANTKTSTPIPVTPTSALPGKTYIDNAQTASSIDPGTALPSQTAKTFNVSQKIYVTFTLHPVNSGAVCLAWYVNQQQFSQFAFSVDVTSHNAYSYAYAPTAGPASVNLYWASSDACTDK